MRSTGGVGRLKLNQPLPAYYHRLLEGRQREVGYPHQDAGEDRGQNVDYRLDADEAKGVF